VTSEGDTLLHVVAACGDDSEEFLRCAKMIVYDYKLKGGAAAVRLALEARNSNGDTPLHCAAAAGNANMISCLLDLIAGTDETTAAVKALVRMQNKRGETVLHQAVQAPENNMACIDQLMDMDPELACIPRDAEEGASPLYLAITLGDMKIARHLYAKSKGNLSYCGPDGRNILHAAVSRAQGINPSILVKKTKCNSSFRIWIYSQQVFVFTS
jgi:ankyrin repeat protein